MSLVEMRSWSSSSGAIACAVLIAGCGAASAPVGAESQEARNCPGGECDPPDPPPPPPPSGQPDPAKFRHAVIPADWIAFAVNTLALKGTFVQISHTDGDELPLPGWRRECVPNSSPELADCLSDCNDFPPAQRGGCRESCIGNFGTCSTACYGVASSTTSFIRWGQAAKLLSEKATCDSTTCPACAASTQVPSLTDTALQIPVYHKDMSIPYGPAWYIDCEYNRWQFHFDRNTADGHDVAVETRPTGLYFTMPGSTGSPAVICSNAPDLDVPDLGLQLVFEFPLLGVPFMVIDGNVLGHFSSSLGPVVDFIADLEGRLSSTVHEIAHGRLNKPENLKLFRQELEKLIARYLIESRLPPLAILGTVQTDYDGLHVAYWTY